MSRKQNSKLAISAAIAVTLGLALVFGYRAWSGAGAKAPKYQVAAVTRGRVAAQVTATGTLKPVVEVQVGSQVSGRIQALGADFNSKVTRGQVVARIDPQLFETDVARARANLTAALATVTRAEAEMRDARQKSERSAALAEKKLVAQADADTARAAYDGAIAGVESARASLSQARAGLKQSETNLAYTTIVSPIDGVVISRDVDVGQTVAASLQAPTLFTIAEDLAKMEVHTSVAESDVGSLATAMPVEFTVDAFPLDRFRGVVKQVRYSPTTVSNVVTYDAVVAVDNPDLKLRPGMTANVTFVTQERRDALAAPNAALRFRPSPEALAQLGYTEDDLKPAADGRASAASAASPPSAPPATGAPAAGAPSTDPASGAPSTAPSATGAAATGSAASGASATGAAASGSAAAGRSAWRRAGNQRVVWRLGADGRPAPVRVATGISDGRVTEIIGGELHEGDSLVTGIEGDAGAPAAGAPAGAPTGGRRGPPRFL